MRTAVLLFSIFLALDIVFAALVLHVYRKSRQLINRKDLSALFRFLQKATLRELEQALLRNWKTFLLKYLHLNDVFTIPEEIREGLVKIIKKTGISAKLFRLLHSRSKLKRKMGIHLLSAVRIPEAGPVIVQTLALEKYYSVKLVMINALIDLGFHAALPDIIDSLIHAPLFFQNSVSQMVRQFGQSIIHYIPLLQQRPEQEIQYFLVNYGRHCSSIPLFHYLLRQVEQGEKKLARQAYEVLLVNYRSSLPLTSFLKHKDTVIIKKSLEALGEEKTYRDTETLIHYLDSNTFQDAAVISLTNHIKNNPQSINLLLETFSRTEQQRIRCGLARVFSNRIEYFLYRILSHDKEKIKSLLESVMKQGFISAIIAFLNANHNREIENEIFDTIKKTLPQKPGLAEELRRYLDIRLLKKIGLEKTEIKTLPLSRKEGVSRPLLIILLLPVWTLFLCIFLWEVKWIPTSSTLFNWFKLFLIKVNYYFIYYSLLINFIYLLLLFLSFLKFRKIRLNRLLKTGSFLRKEGILPSVSVIAPAYCEESSIINSVNSLLYLDYPDYEVIVVNDGSTDRTLSVLTDYFEMEKVDIFYKKTLTTGLVRGIYRSKKIPRLTVVDKRNGGKADSLNAGINLAQGEYCCGIDADSLLETSALMEATGMFLDTEEETSAAGGIVIPVNGCLVEKGQIVETGISRQILPAFQTMEYFRAFTAGRIGWAAVKALVIISGAFGLFKRKRLIQIRGYLTSSEYYDHDTVGEDMELVARLIRFLKSAKQAFAITYSPFAVCWTEVPESVKVISSQRKRWQRGLIETLFLHRNMLFNPYYANYGKFSFPYFFLFEIIGPWIEFQGYICFLIALVLGILNPSIILIIFAANIFFGVFLSLGSLLLCLRIRPFFKGKDILVLVLLTFLENLGFRQWMNFIRLQGYLSALKKKQGWGKIIRRGFRQKEET